MGDDQGCLEFRTYVERTNKGLRKLCKIKTNGNHNRVHNREYKMKNLNEKLKKC